MTYIYKGFGFDVHLPEGTSTFTCNGYELPKDVTQMELIEIALEQLLDKEGNYTDAEVVFLLRYVSMKYEPGHMKKYFNEPEKDVGLDKAREQYKKFAQTQAVKREVS